MSKIQACVLHSTMFINDPDIRCAIVERLVSIFPQSDRACTNANRLFLGTNKEVVLHSKNARISVENILAILVVNNRKAKIPKRISFL